MAVFFKEESRNDCAIGQGVTHLQSPRFNPRLIHDFSGGQGGNDP
jgi:hypothetical protein